MGRYGSTTVHRAYHIKIMQRPVAIWDPYLLVFGNFGQELPIVLASHKFACDTTDDLLLTSFDSLFLNATWARQRFTETAPEGVQTVP